MSKIKNEPFKIKSSTGFRYLKDLSSILILKCKVETSEMLPRYCIILGSACIRLVTQFMIWKCLSWNFYFKTFSECFLLDRIEYSCPSYLHEHEQGSQTGLWVFTWCCSQGVGYPLPGPGSAQIQQDGLAFEAWQPWEKVIKALPPLPGFRISELWGYKPRASPGGHGTLTNRFPAPWRPGRKDLLPAGAVQAGRKCLYELMQQKREREH